MGLHPRARRLGALLLSLLSLLAWGEAATVRPCALHWIAAAPARAPGVHEAHAAREAREAHIGHRAAAQAVLPVASSAGEHGGDHGCRCSSRCDAPPAPTLPAAVAIAWAAAFGPVEGKPLPPWERPRTSGARLLPWANGPPVWS